MVTVYVPPFRGTVIHCEHAIQELATCRTYPPTSDSACPEQYRRKSRSARARKVCCMLAVAWRFAAWHRGTSGEAFAGAFRALAHGR